ncbi:hypothetical protein [Streptomyces sp. NPDC091416]|uniref:hypothetical protein n=1 Tax=Streptomyces sp. NPDC091416 TaxID=3366003 RepID=UPI003812239B
MNFEETAAAIRAMADPADRAKAAAEAALDATRQFRGIELAAMQDLVNAHGGTSKHGAVAAAARELGRTTEAVRKRIVSVSGEDGSEPQEPGGEPGRYFESADEAYAALLDWHLQQQEMTHRRDPLVRGALSKGLSPRVVRDTIALSLDTIDRLESTSPGTAVDVPWDVWEGVIALLADLAPRLGRHDLAARSAARQLAGVIDVPVDDAGRPAELPDTLRGPEFEALSPEEKAELTLSTPWPESDNQPAVSPEDVLGGPDGWAAKFCAELEEAAGGQDEQMAAASRKVAAVLRHVRLTGTLPVAEGVDRG